MGTNYFMQNVVRSQEMFADFDDQSRHELDRLAGPVLAKMLRKRESNYVLVVDGIDENHTYSTSRGILQLTNELAELTCPIVLTTRKEHFDSTFSNFESMLEELSDRRQHRVARVIELQIWSDIEVCDFLAQAESKATREQIEHLKGLLKLVKTGELYKVFQSLPRHPLFLQMLLDLAVTGQCNIRDRVQLITSWVEEKVKRDLMVPRLTPIEIVDRGTFIADMMTIMENVAHFMTGKDGDEYYLVETIDSEVVTSLARDVLGNRVGDISSLVTTSLLMPAARRRKGMPVKFFHRILHEYFLALYLHTHSEPTQGFPREVTAFFTEITSATDS
jgi:hypothetical protein